MQGKENRLLKPFIITKKHKNVEEEANGGINMQKLAPYLMVMPVMIFIVLFTIYPILNSLHLSLFDYNLVKDKVFIGLKNYYNLLFIRSDFLKALSNTSVYSVGIVVSTILFSLLFALWLQKDSKLNRFCQNAIFTPHLIAMFSCGMIWSWIMSDSGILNEILNFFGLPSSKWLNSSDTAMISVIIVALWKGIGYYSLIIMSALKAIPSEIFEAVDLDDTRSAKKFFRIIIPLLSPQLFFLLITITISSFKAFDIVKVMTGGGPGNSTTLITTFIYENAFMFFKVGYASAAANVFLLVLGVLTVFYFRVIDNKVHYQ